MPVPAEKWPGASLPAPVFAPRSVAILPFANLAAEAENEYFSDGITEDIIARASRIADLKVISRTSIMQYKNTQKSMREIGRLLGVDAIFEGSVQRSGDRVRITAQLIRAASDEHIWARTYERDMRDVLALQAEVASAIASEVQVQLTARQQRKITAAAHVSPRAYELYLRGRDPAHLRSVSGARSALSYFPRRNVVGSSWPLFGGRSSMLGLRLEICEKLAIAVNATKGKGAA